MLFFESAAAMQSTIEKWVHQKKLWGFPIPHQLEAGFEQSIQVQMDRDFMLYSYFFVIPWAQSLS
jgi:hypothetical protein